eukprot:58712_1
MDPIKAIYFKRHLFRFEDVWTDQKYPTRNVNDLNGFVCCLCCIIPLFIIKAIIMTVIHLVIVLPVTLITIILLFPYQIIMVYISTLSTALLGPKIKFILFLTNWLFYSVFILFYLLIAILSCIFFSFYAAFKVTLSDNYYVLCGYLDPLRIVFTNISIFLTNNTKEFHIYSCQLKNYRLNPDQGEEVWDISLLSWCNLLMGVIMTLCGILCIMSFVFVEIVLYFIPFSVHVIMSAYFIRFMKHYFGTCIIEQPCLALIACPFILLPIALIPILIALYLVVYVWFYSAFFNKAIIMEAYIDNAFDCLQQWSYIINTILLYNNTLMRYSFQTCWMCHCCFRNEKPEDDGYDLEVSTRKKGLKQEDSVTNPYEIKFKELFAIFGNTKNNRDLVTRGRIDIHEEKQKKREQKEKEKEEKETYRRQQMNIELWTSPKAQYKHRRIDSDSLSHHKQNGKRLASTKNHKYRQTNKRGMGEEGTLTDDELDILICLSDSESNVPGFAYPRGI